jgi:hypothetical protein
MDNPVVASYRNELDCLMTIRAASFRDEVAVLGVDKPVNHSAKKLITISSNFVFENRATAAFDASRDRWRKQRRLMVASEPENKAFPRRMLRFHALGPLVGGEGAQDNPIWRSCCH